MISELARVLEFSLDTLVFNSETIDKNIFPNDFIEKLNKLTLIEQKAAINAAEAVIDTFLEK